MVSPDKLANMGLTKTYRMPSKTRIENPLPAILGQAPANDIPYDADYKGEDDSSVTESPAYRSGQAQTAPHKARDVARVSPEASSHATESGINGGSAAVLNNISMPLERMPSM